MDIGSDFLEWIGSDSSAIVFDFLDDPADLVRASAVSKTWRQFVITNGLSKNLCKRLCPEISHFINTSPPVTPQLDDSSSSLKSTEHKIYTCLNKLLISKNNHKKNIILDCIGASSTDSFPDERIENTLEIRDRIEFRPSYWSSGGSVDNNLSEFLMYRLNSNLCVINEIKIRPFQAFFQIGHPIYASRSVRFKMGYSKMHETFLANAEKYLIADDNYVWTYVSPEFHMQQENLLQSFKLPRPALCIGGVIKIELIGRVQKHSMDSLFYICINHVQVIGRL
ncbi:hypothetical protein LUZ60_014679 [Juncus effusus]|nr:hypothetical protein LUZ60_014679 [Juncus effusus]